MAKQILKKNNNLVYSCNMNIKDYEPIKPGTILQVEDVPHVINPCAPIFCAAIKYYNVIITGKRHRDCYDALLKIVSTKDYTKWEQSQIEPDYGEGFIDENGNFHDRIESKKIAIAYDQLIERADKNDIRLFSEDLY